MSGHQPYIFPIFLPFTTPVSPEFVSRIPVSHEQSGYIITLLPNDAAQRELDKGTQSIIPDPPSIWRSLRNLRRLT